MVANLRVLLVCLMAASPGIETSCPGWLLVEHEDTIYGPISLEASEGCGKGVARLLCEAGSAVRWMMYIVTLWFGCYLCYVLLWNFLWSIFNPIWWVKFNGQWTMDNVGTFWQSCHMKMLVFICRDDFVLVVAEKLSCSIVAGTEPRNTFKIIMRLKIEIISDRRRINQTRCSPGEFDLVQNFFRLLDHRMLWKNFEL